MTEERDTELEPEAVEDLDVDDEQADHVRGGGGGKPNDPTDPKPKNWDVI